MEFNGTFELDGVTVEVAWLTLSDPVLNRQVLPGCRFLAKVDDPDSVDFDALAASATPGNIFPPVLLEAEPDDVADRAFETGDPYSLMPEGSELMKTDTNGKIN